MKTSTHMVHQFSTIKRHSLLLNTTLNESHTYKKWKDPDKRLYNSIEVITKIAETRSVMIRALGWKRELKGGIRK